MHSDVICESHSRIFELVVVLWSKKRVFNECMHSDVICELWLPAVRKKGIKNCKILETETVLVLLCKKKNEIKELI
jgi:hypothetical protein